MHNELQRFLCLASLQEVTSSLARPCETHGFTHDFRVIADGIGIAMVRLLFFLCCSFKHLFTYSHSIIEQFPGSNSFRCMAYV